MTEVFQLGVVVDCTTSTVLVVKVRADSMEEAFATAQKAVRDRIYDHDFDTISAIKDVLRWGDGDSSYDENGISDEDFPADRYDADIDLSDKPTTREQDEAARQQKLALP